MRQLIFRERCWNDQPINFASTWELMNSAANLPFDSLPGMRRLSSEAGVSHCFSTMKTISSQPNNNPSGRRYSKMLAYTEQP
jgi:hypothetical protein